MSASMTPRVGAVIAAVAAAGGLVAAAWLLGRVPPDAASSTEPDPGDAGALPGASLDAARGPEDGGVAERRAAYACAVPDLEIARDPRCARDSTYPACRWQLPDTAAAAGLYVVWRNTTPEHRWARPGLVTLVLAAAREYQARWPGEHLTIGDLDAAGPRHQTHDRGVDVDLYLEDAMLDANVGAGRYLDNYAGRSDAEVAAMRARVMDLARILGTCSGGRLRIYYNDPEIVAPFVAWFAEQGLVSDVGPAMMMHNRLHRFHFHMTVAEDLAVLGARGEIEDRASPETRPRGTE